MYEEKLNNLFDFQHIAQNSELNELIAESDKRQFSVLTREDLCQVSAAGNSFAMDKQLTPTEHPDQF